MPLHFTTVNYLVELAQYDADREVCGFILKNEEVHPILNVAKEPEHLFEMDPHQELKAIEAASVEKMGDQILGMFHSHTSGNPEPSAKDGENWVPDGWHYWIIAGPWVSEWEKADNGLFVRVWSEKAHSERELAFTPAPGSGDR